MTVIATGVLRRAAQALALAVNNGLGLTGMLRRRGVVYSIGQEGGYISPDYYYGQGRFTCALLQ